MRHTDERQYRPVINTLNNRADLSPAFFYLNVHSWLEGSRRLPTHCFSYSVIRNQQDLDYGQTKSGSQSTQRGKTNEPERVAQGTF